MRSAVGNRRDKYGIIDDWYMIREEMKISASFKKIEIYAENGCKVF